MDIENRTGRTVWLGLYSLGDTVYGATTFPWGARKKLGPHTRGSFTASGARQQVVFWTQGAFGSMLTMPKAVFTTTATIAEDDHGCFVYNRLGDPAAVDKIDHFVVLMLENRSFDNLLGWLYSSTGNVPPRNIPLGGGKPYYLGLEERRDWNTNPASSHDSAPEAQRIYARKGARANDMPNPNPSEVCPSFVEQMFGTEAPEAGQQPNMWGFVQNYAKVKTDHPDVAGIMDCYTPDQVPVLSQLAKNYAVCDRWFGSAPCETWPSRSFLHAGTSFGRLNQCDQKYQDVCVPNFVAYAGQRTIFDVLDEQGVRWGVYQDAAVVGTLVSFQFWTLAQKLRRAAYPLGALGVHLASARPPQYIFIEPSYVVDASDQHPPEALARGEALIRNVYQGLLDSGIWYRTLLIITYDEHGGCYDHVPPPAAPVPDRHPAQFAVGKINPFAIYGPRVPAVLVSPYIEPGTVFRGTAGSEYDHTSILASLRDWILRSRADILGDNERIRQAPVVWPVLSRSSARTDRPPVAVAARSPDSPTSTSPGPHQIEILALSEAERILVTDAELGKGAAESDWQSRLQDLAESKRQELEASANSGITEYINK